MSGLHRSSSSSLKKGLPPQELLDDLCSRFVLNVPKEDLESFERILFLVENAHWFYEDNSVERDPSLKSLTLKEFTSLIHRQGMHMVKQMLHATCTYILTAFAHALCESSDMMMPYDYKDATLKDEF